MVNRQLIISAIDELCIVTNTMMHEKGWWEPDPITGQARGFPEQVALQHSELSESLEQYRFHGLDPRYFLYRSPEKPDKPEGIAAEFADVIIRICDTCGEYSIPLADALIKKTEYNATRPHRHGGKKA